MQEIIPCHDIRIRIDSTIGEMSDIETFVITVGNRAQRTVSVVYGKCPFSV